MNVIHKLTLRHLKLNKSRTLVTIIGVILSVTMLTAVTTIVSSAQDMFIRSTMETEGNWHTYFHQVPADKIDVFLDSAELKEVMFSSDLGYTPLEGSGNPNKPYLFIHQYDQASLENLGLNLVEGRLPQTADEIVISEHIGGVNIEVGQKLELPIGSRHAGADQEIQLGQNDFFISEAEGGEIFVPEQTREFTVTGIIQRPSSEPYSAPGYSTFTVLDETGLASASAVNVYVEFKNLSRELYGQSEKLAERAGIEDIDYQVTFNKDLLGFYGISNSALGNEVLTALLTMAAIAIAIIMVGSISLIYNAFAISLSERSRHLGMLASVGATKAQKRSSVFFEGLVISLISIPIGLLAGTVGIGITFAAVNPLLESAINSNTSLRLVVSPVPMAAAVVFSLLTIFISTWVPARRAAKISPIDAIRQSKDVKLTGKRVRTSKLARGLFGYEAELGLKNLKRNRRRYRATVISLTISIVLYLTVAAFTTYTGLSGDMASNDINFDMQVSVNNLSAAEQQEFFQRIAELDLVEQHALEHSIHSQIWVDAAMASDFVVKNVAPEKEGKYRYWITIKSLDDAALAEYMQENDIKLASTSSGPAGILINRARTRDYEELKIIDTEVIKAQVGDSLTVEHGPSGTGTIGIGAITDQVPLGSSIMYNTETIILVVSEDDLTAYAEKLKERPEPQGLMYITSSDPEALENEIRDLHKAEFSGTLSLYNYAQNLQSIRNMLTLLTVFTTGFIVLITGICIVNVMNTISTSIGLRRREFAMLKSVGLTPKGFSRMLRYESIFYGINALAIGLPLSLAVNYLLYRSIGGAFVFPFTLPWTNYLVAVLAVFAVVFVTMLYSSAKVKKENIIDSLKDENM